ncbi:MAG: enoyl-CoA hydratase-related protein, partial [Chloroflexota bacterium]
MTLLTPSYNTIDVKTVPSFAAITLNRPSVRNAMNFQMVDELIAAFEELATLDDVRAVIIRGVEGNFCAGGDLSELQGMSLSENEREVRLARLDLLLQTVSRSPKVVIAQVDGAALGAGFGLVCVSDIAIASLTASFGLPEARLGIAPALIAPYVIQRIGLTRARLLMLTGVRFDGVSAHEYGLVHEVCPAEILDQCVDAILTEVRECSPAALAACKSVIWQSVDHSPTDSLPFRAHLLNTIRQSSDGQEGM